MGIVALRIAVSVVAMSDLATRPTTRTVTVGLIPVAVAVDEQTHRAFVASYGDASLSVLDARSGARVAPSRCRCNPVCWRSPQPPVASLSPPTPPTPPAIPS